MSRTLSDFGTLKLDGILNQTVDQYADLDSLRCGFRLKILKCIAHGTPERLK